MTTTTGTYTSTQCAVAEMLTENTGTNILDSGGAYGRMWERNQGTTVADWAASPRATLDRWGCVTLSVFHYLTERADILPEHDAHFSAWSTMPERADTPWLACAEEYAEIIAESCRGARMSRGGDDTVRIYNTYNGEDFLSQILQWAEISPTWDVTLPAVIDDDGTELAPAVDYVGGERYAWVQIHGGCDARGGYTRPRVFGALADCFGYDNADAELACSGIATECAGQIRTDGSTDDGYPTMHYVSLNGGSAADAGTCGMGSDLRIPDGWSPWDSMVTDDDTGETFLPCPFCGAPMTAEAPYVY